MHGCGRFRCALSGDRGDRCAPWGACHGEGEGASQSARALVVLSAAGAVSLLSSARSGTASTNLIRNWLVSLWAHVSPHRCLAPDDIGRREFQQLIRNSPDSWEATNQWLASRFCKPQISHVMTCSITVASFPLKAELPSDRLAPYDFPPALNAPGDRNCTRNGVHANCHPPTNADLIVMNDRECEMKSSGVPAPNGMRANAAIAATRAGNRQRDLFSFQDFQSRYSLLSLFRWRRSAIRARKSRDFAAAAVMPIAFAASTSLTSSL